MKGQIIKIVRDLHYVKCDGNVYDCKCRGKIRNLKQIPLVGDFCIFDKDKKVIESILQRKNEFSRPPVSNIDQAIIVTSLVEPSFSALLLDKFLVIMEANNIRPIICITKEDIAKEEEKKEISTYLEYYKSIGYKVISNKNIEDIKKELKGKTTVFTGQTGAGKSTLINKIKPELNLETDSISKALGRGKHTTRVVSMFEVNNGEVLDTPGFSALDLNNIDKEEIKRLFIEFNDYDCPFRDCTHINEEECSIKKAVQDSKVLKSRYDNYVKLMEER
jgi:ribosome biogenesis GTPase